MEIKIEVPDYNPAIGFKYFWEKNFKIKIKYENDAVVLAANKEGLISLANHLLNLAQEKVPLGCHLHLDQYNSLEDDSIELIIEKN